MPERDRRVVARWGEAVGRQWTAIPNALLEHLGDLDITASELGVLLLIVRHWYSADREPFPGQGTIAAYLGRDVRNVRHAIASLEEKGYIVVTERPGWQARNQYSLQPLIEALELLLAGWEPSTVRAASRQTALEAARARRVRAKSPLLSNGRAPGQHRASTGPAPDEAIASEANGRCATDEIALTGEGDFARTYPDAFALTVRAISPSEEDVASDEGCSDERAHTRSPGHALRAAAPSALCAREFSPEEMSAWRSRVLERAQVLGWPRVSLMDGKYVRGRDAWPLRVRGALPETLAAMETGLESLAAERDEART